MTFSIDGATQDSYTKYRQQELRRRRQESALAAKTAARRDRRCSTGGILFKWNDSDEEMNLARTLAAEMKIDRLSWEITDHPESAFSRRFVPGTPEYEAIKEEIWDTSNLGNAIPGATPKAKIDVRQIFSKRPLTAKRARRLMIKTRVENLSARPFPAQATYGRRLVRLGAQLCDEDGSVLERDYARAWLPGTIEPGERMTVPIQIVAPKTPGRYSLKFDLVSEGIDWFEACGSPTTTKSLVVR